MAIKQTLALALAATAMPVALAAAPGTAEGATVKRITLTIRDNGRHIRVHLGDNVLVRLRVNPHTSPDPTTWWRPIAEDGGSLTVRPQTAMSVRGTTLGRYRAVARGEATLSSTRSVCPQHGNGPTCHSMQGWNVTVDVR